MKSINQLPIKIVDAPFYCESLYCLVKYRSTLLLTEGTGMPRYAGCCRSGSKGMDLNLVKDKEKD